MGDTTDGSSTAARSAQPEPQAAEDNHVSILDWALRRRGRGRPTTDGSEKPATEFDKASDASARRMLVNLQNMRGMRVENVAIPRADIVAVPDDIPLSELLDVFRESGYSRLPVYEETLDNPVGLIHLKDLALDYGFLSKERKFDMQAVIRPLLFAPPSMPIGALLQKMQNERTHMALVIDEYGGADGLVTMEDMVEQIVGEIEDEHDVEEGQDWHQENDSEYRVAARADLSEFEKAVGVDLLPDDIAEDVDTLGGLAFMLSGRIPARGEVIRHPAGHEIEVLDADPRRIMRMRVRLKRSGKPRRAAE